MSSELDAFRSVHNVITTTSSFQNDDTAFIWLNHSASLNHWGRVTHICVSKLTIIGSDNGLSPGRRQAIIWTNVGILIIGPLGTDFNEILIEILTLSVKKMRLKVSSGKWRPFCLGLNVLRLRVVCSVKLYFLALLFSRGDFSKKTLSGLVTLISPYVTWGDFSWFLDNVKQTIHVPEDFTKLVPDYLFGNCLPCNFPSYFVCHRTGH